MTAHEPEKRRYERVAMAAVRPLTGLAPDDPLIVNVSAGGACLWQKHPPAMDHALALRFRCDGRDHLIQSRIVWSRLCAPTSDHRQPTRRGGWLTGLEFTDSDARCLASSISPDVLRASRATVQVMPGDRDAVGRHSGTAGEEGAGVIALTEESIPAFKDATRDLMPVFSRYFSDVRFVFTRQRVEIAASFRAPVPASPPVQGSRRQQQLPPAAAAAPAMRSTQGIEAAGVGPEGAAPRRSRIGSVAAWVAVALLFGGVFVGLSQKRDATPVPGRLRRKKAAGPPGRLGSTALRPGDGWKFRRSSGSRTPRSDPRSRSCEPTTSTRQASASTISRSSRPR